MGRFSDKAGVDPLADVSVERIGDRPKDSDLLGTLEDVPPTHPALTARYDGYTPKWWERPLCAWCPSLGGCSFAINRHRRTCSAYREPCARRARRPVSRLTSSTEFSNGIVGL
jgi:hypothetical protein